MEVYILAGGKGTRMQGMNGQAPKHLLSILDKLILHRLLIALHQSKKCQTAIVVVKNRQAFEGTLTKIQDHLPNMVIKIKQESPHIGSPWEAMGHILKQIKRPAVFLSGDIVLQSECSLTQFLETCHNGSKKFEAIIAGGQSQPMHTASGLLMDSHRVLYGFRRYTPYTGDRLVNVGCYLLKPTLSPLLVKSGDHASTHRDEDFMITHLAQRGNTRVELFQSKFINVNTQLDLKLAEDLLSRSCFDSHNETSTY